MKYWGCAARIQHYHKEYTYYNTNEQTGDKIFKRSES